MSNAPSRPTPPPDANRARQIARDVAHDPQAMADLMLAATMLVVSAAIAGGDGIGALERSLTAFDHNARVLFNEAAREPDIIERSH